MIIITPTTEAIPAALPGNGFNHGDAMATPIMSSNARVCGQ
jgi:hypothetical protein